MSSSLNSDDDYLDASIHSTKLNSITETAGKENDFIENCANDVYTNETNTTKGKIFLNKPSFFILPTRFSIFFVQTIVFKNTK